MIWIQQLHKREGIHMRVSTTKEEETNRMAGEGGREESGEDGLESGEVMSLFAEIGQFTWCT